MSTNTETKQYPLVASATVTGQDRDCVSLVLGHFPGCDHAIQSCIIPCLTARQAAEVARVLSEARWEGLHAFGIDVAVDEPARAGVAGRG